MRRGDGGVRGLPLYVISAGTWCQALSSELRCHSPCACPPTPSPPSPQAGCVSQSCGTINWLAPPPRSSVAIITSSAHRGRPPSRASQSRAPCATHNTRPMHCQSAHCLHPGDDGAPPRPRASWADWMAVVAAVAGRARAPRTRRRRRRRRLSCWPPCRSRPPPPRAARPPCVTPERPPPRRVAPHRRHAGWDLPRFWAARDAPRPRMSAARPRPGPSTPRTGAAPPAGSCGHPGRRAGRRRQLCGAPVTRRAAPGLGRGGVVRVRVKIMGPGKYENVGESQPALIMHDPMISPRARP
eukprot:COSAG01_NODE_6320_length_3737_cov_2.088785_4_plen_298_part_00